VTTPTLVRRRVRVSGVVQGVGFRPFVHRLAGELGLTGHVGNDADGVFIEIEGAAPDVACFERRLVDSAPPLARIATVQADPVPPLGERDFRIADSVAGGPARTFVSPDVAVCDQCVAEMNDPADRRYRYPFINCTNCGPRFTITLRLPYDRPNTTMAGFAMCPECAEEYGNPGDRRFHAQPIACPACGPQVWFEGTASAFDGTNPVVEGTDPALEAAQAALAYGAIVAVKGIGGYHLACDATSGDAVAELRRRKRRPDKPFAVMAADLAAAGQVAVLGESTHDSVAAGLSGWQRPIVLLRRRPDSPLSSLVAPGCPDVGIFLPYSPLHHLLFRPVPGSSVRLPRFLVMTSGNRSDEPICYDDADARARLGDIADAWLWHDRPIHVPCDDSVVRVEGGVELPIRRSRGYAPLPVSLPFDARPGLAVGGELKNTVCLVSGRHAWMSQHIGDMGSPETLAAFEHAADQFAEMYQVEPETVAVDAHPMYQTRRWVEEHVAGAGEEHAAGAGRPGRPTGMELVQHHHAHIAAVMAEQGVPAGEQVIGFAFDGTGYGSDGAIWGGEVLVAGYDRFERAAHLGYVPLPGGDATIRKPYRAALSHLRAAGLDWASDLPPVQAAADAELAVLARQLQRGVYCVPTSSMGRLFDAVSSLLGVRHVVSYEAQAAIELEGVAEDGRADGCSYRFDRAGGLIDPTPVVRGVVADLRSGRRPGGIALAFHAAVAHLVGDTAEDLRRSTGLNRVALSGGVFQNVLLLRLARAELLGRRFEVLSHRVVPPNDAGLALGQAAIAACSRRRSSPA
jgi:hydrogenase maturation protein HypF